MYGFLRVSDKERELGEAQAEIRALRLSERAREKAVEEVIPNCFHILYPATMSIIWSSIICFYFWNAHCLWIASPSDADCGR